MNEIARFLMSFGIMLFPMLLLTAVVGLLTLVSTVRLLLGHSGLSVRSGIDAVLFWGVVTSLLGFLGQWAGLYKGTQVLLLEAPKVGVNPRAVGIGFAESLRTSILGMAVLLVAAVVWFGLHAWWRHLAERSQRAAAVPVQPGG